MNTVWTHNVQIIQYGSRDNNTQPCATECELCEYLRTLGVFNVSFPENGNRRGVNTSTNEAVKF